MRVKVVVLGGFGDIILEFDMMVVPLGVGSSDLVDRQSVHYYQCQSLWDGTSRNRDLP